MNIEQAKGTIAELENFVELFSNYEVKDLRTATVYEYAKDNHVGRVAKLLNEQGHRLPGARGERKLNSNDVSAELVGEVADDLHKIVKKYFLSNRRKVSRFTW